MEKRLVTTRADENVESTTEITHPIIKWYAEKCKADFKILENDKGEAHRHYRILQLYDLFEEYDRILILDSDILILKTCPNIFDVVPKGKIGSIYEDLGSRQEFRRSLIQRVQTEREDVGWKEGYINTGFALFPKEYRDIFDLDSEKCWMDFGQDDIELGYQIHLRNYEVFELPCEFNFMSMFAEPWSGKNKSDAHVIHYAGQGHNIQIPNDEEIKQDYLILKKYDMIREI